jgi:hypothetical protein
MNIMDKIVSDKKTLNKVIIALLIILLLFGILVLVVDHNCSKDQYMIRDNIASRIYFPDITTFNLNDEALIYRGDKVLIPDSETLVLYNEACQAFYNIMQYNISRKIDNYLSKYLSCFYIIKTSKYTKMITGYNYYLYIDRSKIDIDKLKAIAGNPVSISNNKKEPKDSGDLVMYNNY